MVLFTVHTDTDTDTDGHQHRRRRFNLSYYLIPPSTETEHKGTEPTIAPAAQLAPEDHSQLKRPPELGMLLPVVPAGLDPAVVIPLSTETEHESTEPTIASESQLATAVSSKFLLLQNVVKAKNFQRKLPNQ